MTVTDQLLQLNENLNTINTEVGNQAELISLVKEAAEWLPDKNNTSSGIDLTGTTWSFNEDIETIRLNQVFPNITPDSPDSPFYGYQAKVNFTSDNTNYNGLNFVTTTEDHSLDSYVSYQNGPNWTSIKKSDNLDSWVKEDYKILTITGGQDATSPDLFKFLSTYYKQVLDTSTPRSLVGTCWLINEHDSWTTDNVYNITFSLGSIMSEGEETFNQLSINYSGDDENGYYSGLVYLNDLNAPSIVSKWAYSEDREPRWPDSSCRTIHITGGQDVGNPELISWLKEHAIMR